MKVVSIDMGETLVSFRPRFYENIYLTLKKFGYNIPEKYVFRAVVKNLANKLYPDAELDGLARPDYKELLYTLNIIPRKEIIEELSTTKIIGESYELYPDSLNFLKSIRELGIHIVLTTNATRRVYKIIRELGISQYIDKIIASCDLKLMKPHPLVFYKACKSIGDVDLRDCIHIGDVYEIDVEGAKRAHITPILLDRFNFYNDLNINNKVKNLSEAIELVRKIWNL
ncbi:MAG: HAD family hydrolase [Sulfolobaceae archaeon]